MNAKPHTSVTQQFHSLEEFYPFYLGEHANPTCRRLHVIGTSALILILITTLLTRHWTLLLLLPIVGYGFAWVGHFFFEHNRPATFNHPLYSLAGDFLMLRDVLSRRIPW